jgi:hypothetical protein
VIPTVLLCVDAFQTLIWRMDCLPITVVHFVAARHSFTTLSSLADARVLPSVENATDLTRRRCPLKVIISSPVAESQSLTVRSRLDEASLWLSGEKSREYPWRLDE